MRYENHAMTFDELLGVARRAVGEFGARQKPVELAMLLSLVANAGVVVELGCDVGGTLWALREVGVGQVIGVTQERGKGFFGSGDALYPFGARIIFGDTHDLLVRDKLAELLSGNLADLLIIDADHRYKECMADWVMYYQFARRVAFHDICHHEPTGELPVEVERVWGDVKAANPQWMEIISAPTTWGGIGVVEVYW